MKPAWLVWPPTFLQTVLAVVVAILLLWGAGCLYLRERDKEVKGLAVAAEQDKNAKAMEAVNEVNEAKRNQDEEQRRKEREGSEKLVKDSLELVGKLSNSIAQRDREAAVRRAELLAPKPVDQVVKEAREILGIDPIVHADKTLGVPPEFLQQMNALKENFDRLQARDEDRERQFRLMQDTITRLLNDKASYEKSLAAKDETIKEDKALIVAQREVIESYRRVAKKSTLRKVAEIGGQAAFGIGMAYIGSQLGSRR